MIHSALIYSYVQGTYDSTSPTPLTGLAAIIRPFYQAGFNRKENLYVANLKTIVQQVKVKFYLVGLCQVLKDFTQQ